MKAFHLIKRKKIGRKWKRKNYHIAFQGSVSSFSSQYEMIKSPLPFTFFMLFSWYYDGHNKSAKQHYRVENNTLSVEFVLPKQILLLANQAHSNYETEVYLSELKTRLFGFVFEIENVFVLAISKKKSVTYERFCHDSGSSQKHKMSNQSF